MTQYVTNSPAALLLNRPTVAMAIEFPDESCPPMRCLRHRNRTDRLLVPTAVHLPTNLFAVGFRICAFPSFFSPTPRTRDPNESAHVQL